MTENKTPAVSVIMPVYNGAKYIHEAIDSILNQTFMDFEFIIFNDGSTDASENIIEAIEDHRIIYLKNTTNRGLVFCLNESIKIAKGKYLARMDCDDISHSERFKIQNDFMEVNPDISVCGTYITFLGKQEKYINWVNETESEMVKIGLLFNNTLCHPSIFIRKDFLTSKNIQYRSDYPSAEDYKLWTDISLTGKLANIPKPLLQYRVSETQVSSKTNKVQQVQRNRIVIEQLSLLGLNPSELELNLHLRLLNHSIVLSPDYIHRISEWVQKLIIANNKKAIYNKSIFESFVKELLYKSEKFHKLKVKELAFYPLLKFKIKKLIRWKSLT